MRDTTKMLVALGLALAAQPASALSVAGSIDPQTGLTTLLSWALPLAGIVIVAICAGKGVHAVAEGRHIGPYIGGAVGGTALAFGGAPILQHYGVL
ncbi:MAG: hypothetical protein NVS1B6_01510 [Steroidobacteraceae bacterium]